MNQMANLLAPSWLDVEFSEDRIRERLSADGKPIDESFVANVRAFVTGPNAPTPEWRQGNYVQESLAHALRLQQHLFFRTWRLLRFDAPCLITSDEPVAVLAGDGPRPRGPADASAIWVPVDRQHALAMTLRGTEASVRSGETRARKINQMVADQAERWIICHPEDEAWIPETLGPRTEWRDEVIGSYMQGDELHEQHVLVPRPVSS